MDARSSCVLRQCSGAAGPLRCLRFPLVKGQAQVRSIALDVRQQMICICPPLCKVPREALQGQPEEERRLWETAARHGLPAEVGNTRYLTTAPVKHRGSLALRECWRSC